MEDVVSTTKSAFLTFVLFGVASFLACTDRDSDERQQGASKTGMSAQSTAQKPEAKPDTDEGEEGPGVPAAAAPEKPAVQQASGNSSFTTLIVIRPDSCHRRFTPQRPAAVPKRNRASPQNRRPLLNQTLWLRFQPIVLTTVSLC